ncbi:M23 family metallopeptidase [Calothrix rhizosoleniae]|uniref:M23 family metallopeptidase n=1 Tax=Calothrix rhizosoleniae TaxID=888997 RepID=UPI000B49A348|nr:M23 family metallopeptidase [Calothrix rhizosoleniae]
MFAAVIPLLTDVLPPVPAVIKPMEETNNSSIAIDKDGILISLRNRKLKVSMSPKKSKSKSLGRQSSRKSLLRKLRKYSSRRRYRRGIARGRRRYRRLYSRRRRSRRISYRRRRSRRISYRRRRSRRISYRRRRSRRISYRRRYRRPSLRQRLRRYSARRSSGRFYNPLPGRVVTGRYGYRRYPRRGMHYGVDLSAPRGTPIKPASSGVVSYAGYQGGYGKTVVIKHGNGLSTKYAHMSRILVRRGTTVNKGTTIGRVGSTGFSTGPHLHFEFKVNNYPVNPYRYVRGF